jgi:hypothetical protein
MCLPLHLTPEDAQSYERLGNEATASLREEKFERYQDLQKAQQRVGSFIAKFLHDQSGPVDDIYPTLPSDIGSAVLIGRTVQKFLRGVENHPV